MFMKEIFSMINWMDLEFIVIKTGDYTQDNSKIIK